MCTDKNYTFLPETVEYLHFRDIDLSIYIRAYNFNFELNQVQIVCELGRRDRECVLGYLIEVGPLFAISALTYPVTGSVTLCAVLKLLYNKMRGEGADLIWNNFYGGTEPLT